MKKIITTNHKVHIARQFLESVSEVANTSYYFFVGSHEPRLDATIPEIYDDQRETYINAYKNMIMGKRLGATDFSLMIRNIPYDNKAFQYYDDNDPLLLEKDYYCIVNEGSYYHVYVCLDNINNVVSTSTPTFAAATGAQDGIFELEDGYKWKYMYSVSDSQILKFGTTEYVPVVSNSSVTALAVDGAINVIKVDTAGSGYGNYLDGQFSVLDVNYNGENKVFRITNAVAKSINDYYKGSLLYISDGTGDGQYSEISSSYNNTSGNFVVTDIEFTVKPDATSVYQITPNVRIVGSGSQTINAAARAIVNAVASNSIYKIEILEPGANYRFYTAEVVPPAENSNYILKAAELLPIYSPAGGHGYDVATQLGATKIGISVSLLDSENDTLLTNNDFAQIGILKDPYFSNVVVNFTTSYGIPSQNEKFWKVTPKRIQDNITVSTSSNSVSCATGAFQNQLVQNDVIYIKSSANKYMLDTVSSITSNTAFKLSRDALFSASDAELYYANTSAFGSYSSMITGEMTLDNVYGVISADDMLIGETTGSYVEVDTIVRNGVTKGFDTFIQLYKYNITISSGSFVEDETITSGDSTAIIHSIIGNDMYVSNQYGNFSVGDEITGSDSNAIAIINSISHPELKFGSGDILFIENTEVIERAANQTETFKIIFEF